MKKKKKRTKFWYIQEWGTYNTQTPVFVGYSCKEVTKVMEGRKDWKKEILEAWKKDGMHEYDADGKSGTVWRHEGYTLLMLRDWDGSWKSLDNLLHETMHLVLGHLGMSKYFVRSSEDIEQEGLAYQQEFLFRQIRRRLNCAFKC